MKKLFLTLIFPILATGLFAQTYFPPASGTQWDTLSPSNLGWCQSKIDSLYQFLEDKNSKSFIVLKDGKMVLEKYFGTYTQDSVWYWASAGKSLAGFLVGMAQEQGYLDINDPVSNYLGTGWTSLTPAQEIKVTIRHQISMTTGLEYNVPDLNCLADSCLLYRTDPDSQWYYHNAPYRLVQDVLDSATGTPLWLYTAQQLGNTIGMGGIWFDYVRYGKARDMARFGLLCLNEGVWDGDTLLGDTAYFHAMTNTSNIHNASYGYLWWLNGKSSVQYPGVPFAIPVDLVSTAPADMYAALGKNDQKIYVVPSEGLVVVRQGNAADTSFAALSQFDSDLWQMLSDLECVTATDPPQSSTFKLYPNPASQTTRLSWKAGAETAIVDLYGVDGRRNWGHWEENGGLLDLDLEAVPPGLYFLRIRKGGDTKTLKLLKR